MKQELIINATISIAASAGVIWSVLTNARPNNPYMGAFNVQSKWAKGTEVVMKGIEEDGLEIVVARGVILHHTPLRLLEFSFFEPHLGLADRFENETVISYTLEEDQSRLKLRIQQGDFAAGENSKQRYEIAQQRWNYVLPKIKALAERQERISAGLKTPSYLEHNRTDISYDQLF